MNRRAVREHTFKLIFPVDLYQSEEMTEQLDFYSAEEDAKEFTEAEKQFLIGKAREVLGRIPEIDEILEKSVENWKLNRIGKVELAILRLAVYELLFDEEVPGKVAVNEAVELAKKYGGDESPNFVNGVLARVIRQQGIELEKSNHERK